MTSNLFATVDGRQEPLDACGWLELRPCGCVVSAVVAVVDGEGGWTLATEDQAAGHLRPTKRDRDRADRAGLRTELITMRRYDEEFRGGWNCAEHTTAPASA